MVLPEEIGVYLFYNSEGDLLYIGKAKNIKKRVEQHMKGETSWKKKIARIEFVLSKNEEEALLSEQSMIRRLRPKYNVRLRDDRSFPYIAISWDEEYPRIFLTREKRKKKRKYFGPYLNSRQARKIIQTLPHIFPFRSCQGNKPGREESPCLDWHLGLCGAPCVAYIEKQEYLENIRQLEYILSGKGDMVRKKLEKEMKKEAQKRSFEKAALLRDRIEALGQIRPQKTREDDLDALVFLENSVFVARLRSGLPAETSFVPLRTNKRSHLSEKILAFLFQYYDNPPGEILLEEEAYRALGKDREIFEKTHSTRIRQPKQGKKAQFLEKSKKGAKLQEVNHSKQSLESIKFLEEWVGSPIERVEAYDVSNFGKDHTYVSMVVFENGQKKASDYRLFSIKDREKPDDYQALSQALGRRRKAYKKEQEKKKEKTNYDRSFASKPDLILIDGGIGQLNAAKEALDGFLGKDEIFSLAKKRETVFSAEGSLPWGPGSAPVLFFRKIRDEAHRFALKNSRRSLEKESGRSPLENIPGVGKKRRQALEEKLGDVSQASLAEIESVFGISPKLAERIYHHLHRR